jgi:hypothetical protein
MQYFSGIFIEVLRHKRLADNPRDWLALQTQCTTNLNDDHQQGKVLGTMQKKHTDQMKHPYLGKGATRSSVCELLQLE